MKTKRIVFTLGLIALFVMPACIHVTIKIYFEPEELDEVAGKLVRQEYGLEPLDAPGEGAAEPEEPAPTEGDQGCLEREGLFLCAMAMADEDIDINVETEKIRKLVKRLRARHKKLVPHYDAGRIGPTCEALVGFPEDRPPGDLKAKQLAALRKLMRSQNKDREALFEAVLEANGAPPEALEEVRAAFAEKYREEAEVGWWIQLEDEEWVQKEEEED